MSFIVLLSFYVADKSGIDYLSRMASIGFIRMAFIDGMSPAHVPRIRNTVIMVIACEKWSWKLALPSVGS